MVKTREYFAAANGYLGFKSYFEDIFKPDEYKRIYILKGGPGTGKSTLMKKILSSPQLSEYPKEAIYCSSDPASLDAVIINSNIAIIDGTAPHETDTKIPGAVDKIVNLGDAWNEKALEKNKKEIIEINKSKSNFYNSAYKYLAFIKNLNDYSEEIVNRAFDFEKAEKDIASRFELSSCEDRGCEKIRLISSFSKLGYKRILHSDSYNKTYNISSEYGQGHLYLAILLKHFSRCSDVTKAVSPLDGTLEALFFDNDNTAFIINSDFGEAVDTEIYLTLSESQKNEIKKLGGIRSALLSEAREYFRLASDEHFKLEEIYKSAMDFSKNSELTEALISEIYSILKT